MVGCFNDVDDYMFGIKGKVCVLKYLIEGEEDNWKYEGFMLSMYDFEY